MRGIKVRTSTVDVSGVFLDLSAKGITSQKGVVAQ